MDALILPRIVAFLHDDLDREIVDKMVGRPKKGQVIDLNSVSWHVYKSQVPLTVLIKPKRSSSTRSSRPPSYKSTRAPFFGSRAAYVSSWMSRSRGADDRMNNQDAEIDHAEKDIEWGYARMAQQDRADGRKKMTIALLLLLIIGLIALLWFATVGVDGDGHGFLVNSTGASAGNQAPFTTMWYTPPSMQAATPTTDQLSHAATSPAVVTSSSATSPLWWQQPGSTSARQASSTAATAFASSDTPGLVDWVTSRLLGDHPSMTTVPISMMNGMSPTGPSVPGATGLSQPSNQWYTAPAGR